MRLGVVTVTFSPGEYLGACLESLPAATRGGTHVVMADNGSTDGAPQAAARDFEHAEFLPTGSNLGYGGGMNAGVARLRELADAGEIRSDFVLLTNPDVRFEAGSIDELLACANRRSRAGAVGPLIVEPDGSVYPSARAVPTLGTGIGHAFFGAIWPNNPWSRAYRDDADMSHERTAGWLSGSCLLVRWEAFDAVGGFDERYFMYLEDVDLGDRLARAGWDNVLCPAAKIAHAQGHSTKAHAGAMARAHHDSAYRFQADRHPHWWQAPLRALLKLGLGARARFTMTRASKR